MVEVGLPYSDPMMDGPVIQEAVDRALKGGVRITDVLRTVSAVAALGVPTLVMTYWNPIESTASTGSPPTWHRPAAVASSPPT